MKITEYIDFLLVIHKKSGNMKGFSIPKFLEIFKKGIDDPEGLMKTLRENPKTRFDMFGEFTIEFIPEGSYGTQIVYDLIGKLEIIR